MEQKFTTMAQEAVGDAIQSASAAGNAQVETLHVMDALLRQENGVARSLIEAAGGDPQAIGAAVRNALVALPSASGSSTSQPQASRQLTAAIAQAEKEMQQMGDEYVSTEHLLIGIAASKPNQSAEILEKNGVTAASLRKAVPGVRGGAKVTSPDAEGSYKALERYSTDLTAAAKEGKLDPVIGRDQEIRRVIQILSRRTKNNPVLIGEPGVGKTALAKALAESWFGSEKALLKFDMSEYQEQHTVARLLGAPPGYLGHDEGGQLTEAVRRRPYSVVLFDEIEKARPDIQNVLLQMLEDGQLTDSMGRKADFRNTIVLLTSNLGARFLAGQSAPLGFGAGSEAAFEKQSEAAVAEAKKWFRPELVGRLDELIVFRPLEEQSLCSIAEKLLGQLEERAARSGYQLTHTARVGPALAAKAHSPYGARELRRQVDRAVEQAFADQIASGSVSLGQHWTADCAEDGTIVVQETQTAGVG